MLSSKSDHFPEFSSEVSEYSTFCFISGVTAGKSWFGITVYINPQLLASRKKLLSIKSFRTYPIQYQIYLNHEDSHTRGERCKLQVTKIYIDRKLYLTDTNSGRP